VSSHGTEMKDGIPQDMARREATFPCTVHQSQYFTDIVEASRYRHPAHEIIFSPERPAVSFLCVRSFGETTVCYHCLSAGKVLP
jgi:hypothetical protein